MDQVANKQKTKIKTNQDQVKINGLHLVQVYYTDLLLKFQHNMEFS